MMKQVEIQGQRFELCTIDGGRTWSSNALSLVAFRRRQEAARGDLRKRFEMMNEEILGPDPDYYCELEFPSSLRGW